MHGEWEDAEGEVEGEIVSAIRSSERKSRKKFVKWKIITFFLLFLCYVGVYTCGGCFNVAAPLITGELGYSSSQVRINWDM